MQEDQNSQEQQELIYKLSIYEQQIRQLQDQLQAIEQGITEISSLSIGLDDLKKGEGKEFFAPVGKGIFAKGKLTSSDLIVDVGNKNFVKKTIPETQKIISKQVKRLENVKKEVEEKLEEISGEINRVFLDSQKRGK